MPGLSETLRRKYVSVGIFGIGKSNLSVIEYLKKFNPSARFTLRSDTAIEQDVDFSPERILSGEDALVNISEDILFLSPSVNRLRSEIVKAKKRGVIISSDAELFFETVDVAPICITGSDGKSTTTHLIAKALTLSGVPSVPCGNYGRGLCSLIDESTFPVIELSSFQLNYMKPRSSYALITNITPNHLNWHSSLEEYVEAKVNITCNTQKLIFDTDGDIVSSRLKDICAFSKTSLTKSYEALKAIGGAENYVTYNDGIIYVNGSAFIDVATARRKEDYNLRNFLLTASACMERCDEKSISEAIITFGGLNHRAEEFFEHDGIKFVDSSIDSSPERTLKTLTALNERPVVIIGGMGKGLSLVTLAEQLPRLTRGAVLLGEVGNELAKMLSQKSYTFAIASSMSEAVGLAYNFAKPMGTVILSPAATSYDSYKNFSQRGKDFKKCVLSLFE